MTATWKHQSEAFEFMAPRVEGLLHMGMGTGKTKAALDIAREWKAKRILVVAPRAVVPVWGVQVARHCDDGWWPTVLELDRGSAARRAGELERHLKREPVLLAAINYDSFWRKDLHKPIMGTLWDLVIYDESHRLKDPRGIASRFARNNLRVACKRRMGLTGTFMPHSPLDAWAQAYALHPRYLGTSFVQFRSYYANVDNRFGFPKILGYRNQEQLAERIREFAYTCSRDVLTLPELTFSEVPIELDGVTMKVYKDFRAKMRASVLGGEVTAANALTRTLRLQQITGGAVALDPADEEGERVVRELHTAKQDALQELIEDSGDAPWVVFCRFHHDLDAVHKACAAAGVTSLELSGRPGKRELLRWQNGEAQVLVAQQQTGKEGVDMTRARYIAYYSIGFSLGDWQQSLARVHRPGLKHPATVYTLVVKGTIDEAIYAALARREEVVDRIMQHLTKDEE